MRKELIIFERKDYQCIKKQYEEKGYRIFSFSRTPDEESLTDLLKENENKLVIDISSLSVSILQGSGILFNFEKLISLFPDEIIYISDIQEAEYEYLLRYCFDVFNKYENKSELSNENIEKNDDKISKIIDFDDNDLEYFFQSFNQRLYGHEKFKNEFKELIYSFRVFNKIGEHKILSLFLMGNSGVGKTEVARSIYTAMKGKKKIAKINFGNYSSKDALNSLIGSPRGYIGSDGGELFDKVINSDVGLVLIDEFEKANTPVFNYFLDVLETGKATNSLGEEIDLNGYIIVFTSNIKIDKFENFFSPELRSRFDYKGYFQILSIQDKEKYVKFRFSNIIKKYNQSNGSKLNKSTHKNLVSMIDVEKYDNMRELNTRIKEVFVSYLQKTGKFSML